MNRHLILATTFFFLYTFDSAVIYAQNVQDKNKIEHMQENTFQRILKNVRKNMSSGESGNEVDPFNNPPLRDPFVPQLPKKSVMPTPSPTPISRPRRPQQYDRRTTEQTSTTREAPTRPPALSISGLIWNSKRPQAIVNNQVVDEGDRVENSVIKKIEKDKIIILYADKEFTIPYTN